MPHPRGRRPPDGVPGRAQLPAQRAVFVSRQRFIEAADRKREVAPHGEIAARRGERSGQHPFVAAMICFMALFMTGSRAGTILSLLAIVVTIFFKQGLWGWAQHRWGWSLFPTQRRLA